MFLNNKAWHVSLEDKANMPCFIYQKPSTILSMYNNYFKIHLHINETVDLNNLYTKRISYSFLNNLSSTFSEYSKNRINLYYKNID